jgi:hypothetical protein
MRERVWHRLLAAVRQGELGSLGRGLMTKEEREAYEREHPTRKDES